MNGAFSEPLRIDRNLTLPSRALLAPMEGIVTPVFCEAAEDLQLVDTWISPFLGVSAQSKSGIGAYRRLLEPYPRTKTLIIQLLGHEPEAFLYAAGMLQSLGVRAVNLNFACPSRKALSHGNGGACLKSPDLIHTICEQLVRNFPDLSISAKIRTGFESPEGAKRIVEAIRSAGVPWIICHFRTVREEYRAVSGGLERIAGVVESAGNAVTVFGNGDIRTPEDAEKMIRETGCQGVAVGRAFFQDPYLLLRIRNGSSALPADPPLTFLRKVDSIARRLNYPKKWWENAFTEYARMAFGKDSEAFQHFLQCRKDKIDCFFLDPDAGKQLTND